MSTQLSSGEMDEVKKLRDELAKKNDEIEKLRKLLDEKDEKRKKDEEKIKRQSQQSQSFVSFFKRGLGNDQTPTRQVPQSIEFKGKFKPFQLQANQSLAEIVPLSVISNFSSEQLDTVIANQDFDSSQLYLQELRTGSHKPYRLRKGKEEPKTLAKPSSDLIIVENIDIKLHKAIYLSFHENTRPAYYGTWSKKSSLISGRRPFGRDSGLLNYEVDSDEEWDEEEVDGESIVSSGSDNSRNGADEFEMDDFLVPHGHLSGEEKAARQEEENCRHVTLVKEEDLLRQRNRKIERLDPVVLGPYWSSCKQDVDNEIFRALDVYSYVFNTTDEEMEASENKKK